MNKTLMLMAEFETSDIPLSDICDKYFGLSYPKACRLASVQKLPVPVFRGGSQKSGWLVDIRELAKFIEQQTAKARMDHQRMSA